MRSRLTTLKRNFSPLLIWLLGGISSFAQQTNSAATPLMAPELPNAGASLVRVMGALAVVIGLFLGGVWLFKNWQRVARQHGRAPKLNVLETRSLGGRHSLHVVGYEQARFLVAVSPNGVNLVSHLPETAENDSTEKSAPAPSFAQALTQVLKGK